MWSHEHRTHPYVDRLVVYVLYIAVVSFNYGLLFTFCFATIVVDIINVLDTSFHVLEDCMHHILKS